MAPMPMGKHGYSAIVHNEKIYIFGSLVYDSIGGFGDKDEPEALVDIFSLETYSWRKGLPIPTPFVGMGAVEYKDQLYVAGGADSLKKWSTNGNLFQIPIKTLLENTN